MKNLSEFESWLEEGINREKTPDYDDLKLSPLKKALQIICKKLPSPITAAGTKGKGSVLNFLSNALLAIDKKTILFTSPHVEHIFERWQINGENIKLDFLLLIATELKEKLKGISLSYFEKCFLIACFLTTKYEEAYFLCEVGLGGRFDCANSLDAKIAIITRLGYDHQEILGETIQEIAGEKCAIARENSPCVISEQTEISKDDLIKAFPPNIKKHFVVPKIPKNINFTGGHQKSNAETALAVFEMLFPNQKLDKIFKAFEKTTIPARCELFEVNGRKIIIDSAHNDISIKSTIEYCDNTLSKNWQCIFGLMKDKNLKRIIPFLPKNNLNRCGFENERARKEKDWEHLQNTPWHKTIKDAFSSIPNDKDICITGSFGLAGEARTFVVNFNE